MPAPARRDHADSEDERAFVRAAIAGLKALARTSARTFVSPPQCSRRASVALLLRFRPHPDDLPRLARDSQSYASLYPRGVPLVSAEAARLHDVLAGRLPPVQEEQSSDLDTSGSDSGRPAPRRRTPPADDRGLGQNHSERTTLPAFLAQDWVQRSEPQVFYIQRATRPGDRWSAHVAFPGGKREEEDESDLFAALRETWEEAGLDLAEDDFCYAGRLDDREISGAFGSRLLMILASFVFVQTTPFSPEPHLQTEEVASAHWVPLRLLADQAAIISKASVNGGAAPVPVPPSVVGTRSSRLSRRQPDHKNRGKDSTESTEETQEEAWEEHPYRLSIDIASRLVSTPLLQPLARWLLGSEMHFYYAPLPNRPVVTRDTAHDAYGLDDSPAIARRRRAARAHLPPLQLWGITLGITLDFLDRLFPSVELGTITNSSGYGQTCLPPKAHCPEHGHNGDLKQEPNHESGPNGVTEGRDRRAEGRVQRPNGRTQRRLPPLLPLSQTRLNESFTPLGSLYRLLQQVRLRMLARLAVPTPGFNTRAMRSIVPSFPALDINVFIHLSSGRYRRVLADAERGGRDDPRNWVAISVHAYYLALRRALLATLITRSLLLLILLGLLGRLARRSLQRWLQRK